MGPNPPAWPAGTILGGLLKPELNDALLLGVSKLGVLVTLKTLKAYLMCTRSLMAVSLKMEISPRFWNGPRKRLRPLLLKVDSNVSQALVTGSQAGTPSWPGCRNTGPKAAGFNPPWPSPAVWGVKPGARGTMGLVMKSLVE